MPELPEVETVRRGLLPYCQNQIIKNIVVRESRMRWPVPSDIQTLTANQEIKNIARRGKYLLFELSSGTLIVHLGMSGVLQICDRNQPLKKHDHVDILLKNGVLLRYNDPRRFGAVLYTDEDIEKYFLLNHLGPEPFDQAFNANYIFAKTRGKKVPIKSWLMDATQVVGVGNIYACEILFLSNLHPFMPAGEITRTESEVLHKNTVAILHDAIKAGGTTLKDFKNAKGKPGYFIQQLNVYGMENKPCCWCGSLLENRKLSGRQTVFCPNCQPLR